jgi:hypothetical protein
MRIIESVFYFPGGMKLGIYSQSQIKAARQADLPAWLNAHGYNLKREGKNWRVPGYAGLFV